MRHCDICDEPDDNIRTINDFRLCPGCYNGLKLQSGDLSEIVTEDWTSPKRALGENGD